jgi:hypothetical protein
MSLMYLSDRALAQLRHDLPRNAARYSAPDPWLSEAILGSGWCRETGVALKALPQLEQTRPADDLQNTRLIHTALRTLTPVQAMDERLWTYLAHVTYWKYMQERWGSDAVAARYFFKNRGISGLTLHGIARLWWFGHVTYDPGRPDPYELTGVLLSMQDIQTGLLQRTIGRSAHIRRFALEFIRRRKVDIENVGASRAIQALFRDLNLAGGVYLLDALKQEPIDRILDESLDEMASEEEEAPMSNATDR